MMVRYAIAILLGASPLAWGHVAYENDFDGGEYFAPGVGGSLIGGTDVSVDGLAGLGNPGNTFSGNLRQTDGTITLTLTNLPAHTSIDLDLLFVAIDSWDGLNIGTGVSPDLFNIKVGTLFYHSESYRNAFPGDDIYYDPGETGTSYSPPPGGFIPTDGGTGFGDRIGQGNNDGAYDLSLEPSLSNIPHTAGTLTIEFFPSGSGWQYLPDEGIGIENLRVTLIPEPTTIGLVTTAGLVFLARRRR